MTYNIRSGFGLDGRLDLERIARVIEAQGVDVVALQEVDAEQPRSQGLHQAHWLAERLGMRAEFTPARDCEGGRYGIAVLSRHPGQALRSACLPRYHHDLEPRALQWVRVDSPSGPLNLLNTHLGLDARERLMHAVAIVGRDWVDDALARGATVLCGDFNALPRSVVYRKLTGRLDDAQYLVRRRLGPLATFPSIFPLLRIDHVLVSPDIEVRVCRVVRDLRARVASDHLPLIADLEPKGGGSWRAS